MSRKKEVPTTTPAAEVTTPEAEVTTPAAEATTPASKSQAAAEKHAITDKKENAPETPAPFSLQFDNVSALEFNFLSAKDENVGVANLLRFAGFLGTKEQKFDAGKNLVFETRDFDDTQEPKYLFEIIELLYGVPVRTARHYAINKYWSLAQFFSQEIADNADTIANNLYQITLTEIRKGAAKGGNDLPIFRIEKASAFSFNL
jgi:hypothetical protein